MKTKKKKRYNVHNDKNEISISIIIPCYNQEKYIEECLQSILNQKFNNYEIICVNDGSTDNTLAIINQYKTKNSKVKVISFDENKGTSQARKAGVLNSRGKYIMFVDPDDTLANNALEIAFKNIEKQKVDILQFGTNVINIQVNETTYNIFTSNSIPYDKKLFNEEVFFSCFDKNLYNFNLWNKIYNGNLVRKSFQKISDGYYPKAQDVYAFFIIAFYAKSYGAINDKLYNYYYGRGITGKKWISINSFFKIPTQMQIIEQLYKFLDDEVDTNIEAYLNVLYKRGTIFFKEILYKYKNIEDLDKNYLEALESLIQSMNPHIKKEKYKNIKVYESYISLLFEVCYDLLFDKIVNNEMMIYNYLINMFLDNDLFDMDINILLFKQIKALANAQKCNANIIPVVFATNDNYAPYLSVSIQSIKDKMSNNDFYDIYVFHTSLSLNYQTAIRAMSDEHVSIRFINVTQYVNNLPLYACSHYSVEMYYRILIPEILHKYDKVIYLDCDLIINRNLSDLYKTDISEYVLGVIINKISTLAMQKYLKNSLNFSVDKYFNSGVLLLNIKNFEKEDIKNKCFEILKTAKRLTCPDQDILNLACEDKCLYLDPKWNFQCAPNNFTLQDKYMSDKYIIHYTSNFKPWNTSFMPLSEKFWQIARRTPFYELILQTYMTNTLKIKSKDQDEKPKVRNIINVSNQNKNLFSWPFRMIKKFFESVRMFGWKRTLPKVKIKLKYVFNRLTKKVDIDNNTILKENKIKKEKVKNKDLPKNLQDWFYSKTGIKFDIEKPQSLSEKIQWIKIYDANIMKSHLTDKWLAKEYVKSLLGEQYIIKSLGVYDNFDDIDFSKLPNKFVIKSTHGSGQLAIVRDKNSVDMKALKAKAETWLKSTYAFHSGFEMHYQNIIPRLIIEELVDGIDGDLYDYKVMCFNGKPEFIWVDTDRFKGHRRTLFDLDWNRLPVKYHHQVSDKKIPKPRQLQKLLEISEKLSAGFTLCRCDFYILADGSIKFGELTFTSASGIDRFDPISFDYELGKKLILPKKKLKFKKYPKQTLLGMEKEFLNKYRNKKKK